MYALLNVSTFQPEASRSQLPEQSILWAPYSQLHPVAEKSLIGLQSQGTTNVDNEEIRHILKWC